MLLNCFKTYATDVEENICDQAATSELKASDWQQVRACAIS